jgi:iron complex outermembrane receptor protein
MPSLSYVVSANHLNTEGWREHSGARRDLANVRLDYKAAAGGEWTVVANSLDMCADDPLGLTRTQFEAAPRSADASALLFNTRKTVRQNQLGLIHEHRLDAGYGVLRLIAYGGQRDTGQFQAIPVAAQSGPLHPGGVIDLERRYAGADLRWTLRVGLREGVLSKPWQACLMTACGSIVSACRTFLGRRWA